MHNEDIIVKPYCNKLLHAVHISAMGRSSWCLHCRHNSALLLSLLSCVLTPAGAVFRA
jgi:hypothetical protein